MENTNNEIKEVQEAKYTNDNIMQGFMALSEVDKSVLSTVSFEKLWAIANDSNYLQAVYDNCDKNINAYQMLKDAVKKFVDTMDAMQTREQKSTSSVIEDMIGEYKKFNREEKLEFNRKLLDATSLESSLDTFSYSWDKLMNSLRKIKL